MHDIEHRTTKVRSPRTNGFVVRMNRTLLDECFQIKGRRTWYNTPEEIQRDLDEYLAYYNLKRSHQGYRLKGRTPAQRCAKPSDERNCRPLFQWSKKKPQNRPPDHTPETPSVG